MKVYSPKFIQPLSKKTTQRTEVPSHSLIDCYSNLRELEISRFDRANAPGNKAMPAVRIQKHDSHFSFQFSVFSLITIRNRSPELILILLRVSVSP